jgi:hypothetical protein
MLYDRVSLKYISYMVGEAKRKVIFMYLCKKHERNFQALLKVRKTCNTHHSATSFEYLKVKMHIEEDFRLNGVSGQMVHVLFNSIGV